jgi:hypothetical protein
MLSTIGLILIIVGWGIQLFSKKKSIAKNFILAYCLGVVLLVIDGWLSGLTNLAVLNSLSFVAALAVYFKIKI